VRAHPPDPAPPPADVLAVLGHQGIGAGSLQGIGVLTEAGLALTSDNPPGILALLLNRGVGLDVVTADRYTAALGDRYRAVIVGVPGDAPGSAFQDALAATRTPVLIAHPSFLVGTPTAAAPTAVSGAYCSEWNQVSVAGRSVGVQVWGSEVNPPPAPSVHFTGALAGLGTIIGYQPNRTVFSYYQGSFDEVLATAELPSGSFPCIARIGNVTLFGLVVNLFDPTQRQTCQAALLDVLSGMGVTASSEAVCEASPRSSSERF